MTYYERSVAQHRAWEHKWAADASSWLEQTLGRLAGTHARCVNIAECHGTAAAQYELLAQGYGTARQASAFEDRVMRVMQHAGYSKEACAGMITPPPAKEARELYRALGLAPHE